MLRLSSSFLVALAMALHLPGEAAAAVRVCKAPVSSAIFTGKDESATKKQALDDWKAKAKTYGENYTNWRLAGNRLITCLPAKAGGFECVAHGSPCVIENVPPAEQPDRKDVPA